MRFGMGIGLKNARNYNADYALEFNGTDEYLSIALPNNELLASAGVTDFYSSGSAIAGWTETGTVNWASGVSGKTYTETITLDSDSGISKTIIGLIVGQKYKLKIRCKTGYEGLCFGTALGESQYDTLIAHSGEWNTISKVFTAESTELFFSTLSTSAIIDYASVKRDQGFDLNKDQEQILHSKNADFERTLGTELNSGTVTIGKKYIVTAGTVEGNAVGTEFLAITNATTLDASNKVREIPNLVTNGTFDSASDWVTFNCTQSLNTTDDWLEFTSTVTGMCGINRSFGISGKRYKFTFYAKLLTGTNTNPCRRVGNNEVTASDTISNPNISATFQKYEFNFTAGDAILRIYWNMTSGDVIAVDNIHICEIPEWTASGNHTGDISILDKSGTTGTQSYLISASGAGDSGSNHVKLPSANIESCVAGKKYTLEGYAKLDPTSLTYGSNLLSGDGTGGWTAGYGTGAVVSGEYVLTSATRGYIQINLTTTVGKIIKFSFKAKSNSYTGGITVYHGPNYAGQPVTGNLTAAFQTFTSYCIASTTGDKNFYIQLASNFVGDVILDDIAIYESDAVAPTVTAQLGSKSVTSSALSIVAGTFTKFVLNFEATASEVNQDLKLYLSGAGNVYVDKLSLTQRFDYIGISKYKANTAGTFLIGCGNDFRLIRNSQSFYFNDEIPLANDYTGTSKTNEWLNATTIVKHDISSIYENGVLIGSDTDVIGKISIGALTIGARNGVTDFLNGQISHIQIIRFENISQSTFNSAITGLQYPTGGGAEEVLRLTFSDGTTINNTLKDYSAKNHTVTGINIDSTNRKRVI